MKPEPTPVAPAEEPPLRATLEAPPTVTIQVGELALHGFPSGDRHRIGEAFQQELARLMSEPDALSAFQGDSSLDRLSGGSFQFNADARQENTGREIARAVFGGLKQ